MIPVLASRRFERDFAAILRYVRNEASGHAADNLRDKVFDAVEVLAEHPESYPPEPRLAHLGNYRIPRMRRAQYKIFYRFTGTQVHLERMFHAKRDFDRIFRRFKF